MKLLDFRWLFLDRFSSVWGVQGVRTRQGGSWMRVHPFWLSFLPLFLVGRSPCHVVTLEITQRWSQGAKQCKASQLFLTCEATIKWSRALNYWAHLSKSPSDLEQKCTQLQTPFFGTVFNALSLDENHFVQCVSLTNRFLIGRKFSIANEKLPIQGF